MADALGVCNACGSRTRCSYKHATIVICCLNVVTLIFLLQALLAPFYRKSQMRQGIPERAKFVTAGEEIRRAMEPMDLIKRIKELQLESESASENQIQRKVSRQNNAAEISKRLNDLRSSTDQNSQKALEEWRKRKMERAKKREMGKNATSTNTGVIREKH
ncbi:hypothetical protein SUGI_0052340 [Cryptomeria japonica]|uniref:uncharacterized protein LOC131070936 isoform X2 n=1 Tax=Cryptomeria japonica TaxID=3369 RepID=UPI002408CBB4|nr:uncharacterized protein LOC131070936 isoform X2 [Cryptomeria japonica]GLJ06914.1 hypothetical protein SUGI_0052340 [Cryptomeria japonica]